MEQRIVNTVERGPSREIPTAIRNTGVVATHRLGNPRLGCLLEADEFEDGARRLLGERQHVAIHREFVLSGAAGRHGERAFGHHGTCSQHVAPDGVAAGVHVQHIEDRDLVGIGGLVIRGIGWERLGAVEPDGAVVFLREDVQTGLRIGERRTVRIGDLRNLPSSHERVFHLTVAGRCGQREDKQPEKCGFNQSAHGSLLSVFGYRIVLPKAYKREPARSRTARFTRVTAYEEDLVSLDELRHRMPELRLRTTSSVLPSGLFVVKDLFPRGRVDKAAVHDDCGNALRISDIRQGVAIQKQKIRKLATLDAA